MNTKIKTVTATVTVTDFEKYEQYSPRSAVRRPTRTDNEDKDASRMMRAASRRQAQAQAQGLAWCSVIRRPETTTGIHRLNNRDTPFKIRTGNRY